MSGISVKMSGKSAKCMTMSERVANPRARPKMSKNTPNVWQLCYMGYAALVKRRSLDGLHVVRLMEQRCKVMCVLYLHGN